VAIAVTAKGSTANGATPAVEGTLAVKNAGAKLAQLPAPVTGAGATVHFTDHSARCEDAALSVGQSRIRASFSATSLSPLAATFRVTSDRIHRNDFQVPVQKVPRPEVLDDVVATGSVRADPAKPEANVLDAKVASASGTVANLDYTDLQATVRSEGDIIRIEQFTANTLDGKVSGSGTARPTAVPPTFDVQTSVNSIDLTKYFQDKFPNMVSVIEGRIDLNVNIAGAGKTWEEIAASLEGAGGAVVVRGALLNVNLANELVASLQQIPMVPAGLGDRLRAKHPQLFSGNSTAFQNLNGEFTIDGGRIRSDDLFLKAADFYIKGDGWLGFDRTLSLRTSFVFSEKLSRDIVLPLVLSGDLINPRIAPDSDAITAALRQGAVDEGKNRLQDEIKDRLGDGVKDLFGGLGKKKDSEAPADSSGGKR
jgi:AsmA protein